MNRLHERVDYLTETHIKYSSGRQQARISDVSLGGCFVDSIVHVREGEPISISVPIPDGRTLRLNGRVAYTMNGGGFGVDFTDLNDDDVSGLNALIATNGG